MYRSLLAAGLFSLTFVFLARGYIIDDTNSTIEYSEDTSAYFYQHMNTSHDDNSRFFNGTYRASECRAEDNCHIKIPFTGSGITIYNYILNPFNTSFTIDGGPSHFYLYDSCSICYNVSTINVRSLANDDHMLDITLLDYNGSRSDFAFDYAIVHVAQPATATSLPAVSNSTSSSNPSHVAVAIGGALGGLAVIVALILAFLYIRNGQRPSTGLAPFRIDAHQWTRSTSSFVLTPNGDSQMTTARTLFSPTTPPSKFTMMEEGLFPSPPSPVFTVESIIQRSRGLSEQQFRLVRNLLRRNVPVPVVASVVEDMLSEGGPSTGARVGALSESDAPPSYYSYDK